MQRLGARLLSIDDETEAARIAVLLDKLNRERKTIETQMLDEAMAHADQLIEADASLPLLMIASKEFHKGVVGLVASRLVERFQRPACVIAWDGKDEGTGSLRSIAGVDIGAAVRAAVTAGHLKKGGGHAMAGGLTVARDRLDALRAFLGERLAGKTDAARSAIALKIDGALTPASVTDEFMALIERAGPYGQGNPEPRFAFPAHRVKFAKVVGTAHVRCTLEAGDGSRLDAVAFRAADQPDRHGIALLGRHAPAHRRTPAPRHLERPRPPRARHRGRGRPAPARLSECRDGPSPIRSLAAAIPLLKPCVCRCARREGSFTRCRGPACRPRRA